MTVFRVHAFELENGVTVSTKRRSFQSLIFTCLFFLRNLCLFYPEVFECGENRWQRNLLLRRHSSEVFPVHLTCVHSGTG